MILNLLIFGIRFCWRKYFFQMENIITDYFWICLELSAVAWTAQCLDVMYQDILLLNFYTSFSRHLFSLLFDCHEQKSSNRSINHSFSIAIQIDFATYCVVNCFKDSIFSNFWWSISEQQRALWRLQSKLFYDNLIIFLINMAQYIKSWTKEWLTNSLARMSIEIRSHHLHLNCSHFVTTCDIVVYNWLC